MFENGIYCYNGSNVQKVDDLPLVTEIRKDAQKEFEMGDVEQDVFDDFISKLDHEIDYED